MKYNKPHTNAHANKNIGKNSIVSCITKSKSYVENIDGQKPSVPKPKPSFSLTTHSPANNSHCKQTKVSKRKNQTMPVRNQKCSYLFSVIVKDSIEQSSHTCDSTQTVHDQVITHNHIPLAQCNNLLRKLRKHDNIRQKQHDSLLEKLKTHDNTDDSQQTNLLQKLEKNDRKRHKQHIRLLNKIKSTTTFLIN